MPDKKKVVVTGFGGRIGKVLRDHLGDKYEFSGIDRVPLDGLDSLTADLTDLDAISPAFEGKDAVIHLAPEPRHTPHIPRNPPPPPPTSTPSAPPSRARTCSSTSPPSRATPPTSAGTS